jgi:hypothetical protein
MKTFYQIREFKESFDLNEMKMNDPKLLKMFDKLKKGSKIKLKISSAISQGKDYVEYIVKSKNLVNKGRVEKVTLATVGNEGAVKKFLYKRDGQVAFAIGNMGASIDDIKEQKDPGEYDQEGDMAKTQLRTMIDAAKELHNMLGKDDNLPEWVQNKITKATDYIDSARDYIKSGKTD